MDERYQSEPIVRPSSDIQRSAQYRINREKDVLRRAWVDGGGTELGFEEAWPGIRSQLGQTRVMAIGEKARAQALTAFRKR